MDGGRLVHELVVRGGTVVDGSGGMPVVADVAIDDGRITAVGPGLDGAATVDANGALVVPGFVDLHTHYDPQVLWDPEISPSSQLGVTAVVAGNCGFSIAPCPPELRASMMRTLDGVEDMRFATLEAGIDWDFTTYPEYLASVERRGTAINFGGYVGHSPVRLWVMGDDAYEREASDDEIERMAAIVCEAIEAGALGFSSDRSPFHRGDGGRRVPSAVATQAELEAIWAAVGRLGRGVLHVAPGEDYHWVYDAQRRVGRPVTWSAILAYDPSATSKAPWATKLADHRAGIARGADVHPQVTCRPITFQVSMADPTSLYMLPSFAAVMAGDHAARRAIYEDAAWRATARTELDAGRYVDVRWDRFVVAETNRTELVGMTAAQLAARDGVHALDAVLDLALSDALTTRFTVSFANDDPAAVQALLQEPGCVLGLSDAGAHVSQLCDASMPLDYLAHWVRDRGVTSVEAGIRRLTGELADLLGLRGRGYVRPGYAADLVVLEWDELSPGPVRRVHDLPAGGDRLVADDPRGLRHILVNGRAIRRDHAPVADTPRPGQILDNRPHASGDHDG
jgi:N-acyl-D-aspartate/D-glutamate deacylase